MEMNKPGILWLLASQRFQAISMFVFGFLTVSALFNNCSKIDGTEDLASLDLGPRPIISSTLTSPTTVTPIPLKISFNTDVVGLTVEDFVVTNGTATGLITLNASNYSLDVTAAAWGQVTVVIPAGVAKDISNGQINAVSNTYSITFGSNDANAFSIAIVDDKKFPYYFGRDGGAFGSSCAVLATAPAAQEITCTLDLNEGDVWFWGYKFKYQSPPGMCKYLSFNNYYFYNYEVGYGPTAVTVYKNDNSPTLTAAVFPTLPAACVGANTCCVVIDDAHPAPGLAYANCQGVPEISAVSADGKPTCRYDYTKTDGPNCCVGPYRLTVHKTRDNAGTIVADLGAAEQYLWDGKFGDCMGGPAADDTNWPKIKSSGAPADGVVEYAASGINEEYQIQAPNVTSFAVPVNISAINSFTNVAGNTPHAHTVQFWNGTALVNVTSNLPYGIEPIADRSGDGLDATNSNFVFDCLDEAFEVKHRIRMKAREWNTYAAYLAYGASAGATVSPDVVGIEGTICTERILVSGGYCNDNMDWDDTFPIGVGNQAGFQTLRVGGYVGERYNYFPRIPRGNSAPIGQ